MPVSDYVAGLRQLIGPRLLVLPGVTAVIRDDNARYLLALHVAGNRWGLIGGAVEPLEGPRDALKREVWEEIGADIEIHSVLDSYGGTNLLNEYPNGDLVSYVTTVYLCQLVGDASAVEADEVSDIGWFSRDEIRELERFEWIDTVLDDAQRFFDAEEAR
ncbi:DNA mismatch repair protein MutT [Arthrobacter sp. MYb224]|uniref:NUDIX domain-containing protein n=1 Tax=Micrococcaceae TaxID=1268 RepID=UPI000CFA827B|nr:NUDIX domain-containing protein [Arthrobacter sp. MYb224]PQZ98274.1 DNA mismatch repair protein MutT [Arthrobacter sp. MYb224]